MSLQDRKERGC